MRIFLRDWFDVKTLGKLSLYRSDQLGTVTALSTVVHIEGMENLDVVAIT